KATPSQTRLAMSMAPRRAPPAAPHHRTRRKVWLLSMSWTRSQLAGRDSRAAGHVEATADPWRGRHACRGGATPCSVPVILPAARFSLAWSVKRLGCERRSHESEATRTLGRGERFFGCDPLVPLRMMGRWWGGDV